MLTCARGDRPSGGLHAGGVAEKPGAGAGVMLRGEARAVAGPQYTERGIPCTYRSV